MNHHSLTAIELEMALRAVDDADTGYPDTGTAIKPQCLHTRLLISVLLEASKSICRGSADGYLGVIRNSVTPRSESNHAEHRVLRWRFRRRRRRCFWRQRWGQRRRRHRRCLWWWWRRRGMAIPTTWTRWCWHCWTLTPFAVMPVRTGAAALPFPFPCEHGGGGSPVLPPVLAASRIAEADAGAQS